MRAIGTQTGKTWRAHNLLAKTRAADSVFLDQRLRAIVAGVIGKLNQVNITTLFNTLPGETKQFLHQDDGLWPIPRPHPPFSAMFLSLLIHSLRRTVPLTFVPGSHKLVEQVDQSRETIQVEMGSGSALFWEGGTWHAGGANVTTNQERMGLFISHQVSYLRPQESQLISVPRKSLKAFQKKCNG